MCSFTFVGVARCFVQFVPSAFGIVICDVCCACGMHSRVVYIGSNPFRLFIASVVCLFLVLKHASPLGESNVLFVAGAD